MRIYCVFGNYYRNHGLPHHLVNKFVSILLNRTNLLNENSKVYDISLSIRNSSNSQFRYPHSSLSLQARNHPYISHKLSMEELNYDEVKRQGPWQMNLLPVSLTRKQLTVWQLTVWQLTVWHLTVWQLTVWQLTVWQLTVWHLTVWQLTVWQLTLWTAFYTLKALLVWQMFLPKPPGPKNSKKTKPTQFLHIKSHR